MNNDSTNNNLPSLPQNDNTKEQYDRAFNLSVARTSYNYMQSYLEGVPLSADVPAGENFSAAYDVKVLEAVLPILENFKKSVIALLERELMSHLTPDLFKAIEESYSKLEQNHNPLKEPSLFADFVRDLGALPKNLKEAVGNLAQIPKDLMTMLKGLDEVFAQAEIEGVTAFMKSTLFLMLYEEHGADYLDAKTVEDYTKYIFETLPLPLVLTLPEQPWMKKGEKPCEQDWYFGYTQTGGYNTTNLTGVCIESTSGHQSIPLGELQKKFPITDAIFQSVINRCDTTLLEAARQRRLFVCDYTMMVGATTAPANGKERYICAPIALFYWNPSPPEGYPHDANVMQPIAIQLAQQFDAETAPIFTPNNCSNADDANGLKWKIAKYIVNVISETQHETVAHLGACHLTVEPMVVATNRHLSDQHPIFQLLKPHFRFTIQINNSAAHSLIIPGGVVATVLGTSIESSMALVANAHAAWRWDEQCPDQLFARRGVDAEALGVFPFRDDTLLLWDAIQNFVGAYIKKYYHNDDAVINDYEVQNWVNELVNPLYAGLKGMNGLKETNNPNMPYKIDSRDYLIKVVSFIIYIAGPQHASVNYAQYPLMTYTPSAMASLYKAPPTRSTVIANPNDCLPWYPPLDIVLYTVSFGNLLSAVQFDTFGHYNDNPRIPYFKDPEVVEMNMDFQAELSRIETTIRQRNKTRPMPFMFQLPSLIPNSISI